MKSKEEILFPLHTHCGEELEMVILHDDALKAMDEYAQQEAVEFAKWISDKGYYYSKGIDLWQHVFAENKKSEQLYELFLQSKQK